MMTWYLLLTSHRHLLNFLVLFSLFSLIYNILYLYHLNINIKYIIYTLYTLYTSTRKYNIHASFNFQLQKNNTPRRKETKVVENDNTLS